jgi:hypothetical protein
MPVLDEIELTSETKFKRSETVPSLLNDIDLFGRVISSEDVTVFNMKSELLYISALKQCDLISFGRVLRHG